MAVPEIEAPQRRPRQREEAPRERIPTVVVDDAHVTYRAYEDRRPRLREVFTRVSTRAHREIQAVRGVSLTAYAGDVIGVVGRNGSGKSTLLRAIAGLMPVTEGAVYARSEPVLLGVNAALQPELSGSRNIELGGLALGMSRKQVEEALDEIIEFSGLGQFIDLPIRTYSSGMRARLHFAIATAVSPDILLIDEALGAGDIDFRRRSKRRIQQLRKHAGTVFLVSHRLQEIQRTCNRAIWLHDGQLVADGQPRRVLRRYRTAMRAEND